jgi:hypothetical protein
MVWGTVASALAVGGMFWVGGALILPWAEAQALTALGMALALLAGAVGVAAAILLGRRIWETLRHAFLELPADSILLDMGRALLAALRDVGAVSVHLNDDCVRVAPTGQGSYEIFLDPSLQAGTPSQVDAAPPEDPSSEEHAVSPEDSDTFSRAYRQMLGPLGDARYLIERDSTSLRNPIYRASWRLVRKAARLEEDLKAFHRVPDVLASRRERAETLARHWKKYVGGGRLVYTRNADGRRILLQARAQQQGRIRQTAFEIWR